MRVRIHLVQDKNVWRAVVNPELDLRKLHRALDLVGCCEHGNEPFGSMKGGGNS